MIVIGADTPVGDAIVQVVSQSAAEVRAFISFDRWRDDLKMLKVRVALGDVSDFSHVEAACSNCFCAVLVVEAAVDGRERAFADDRWDVLEGWAEAIRNAGVRRAIWVGGEDTLSRLPSSAPEVATVTVEDDIEATARRVAYLEELVRLVL